MLLVIPLSLLKNDFNYAYYVLGLGLPLIWTFGLVFAYKKKATLVPMTDEDRVNFGFAKRLGEIQRAVGIESNCRQCNKPILKSSICVMQYNGMEKYWNHFKCEPNRKKIIKLYYSEKKRREYPELDLLREELE